jgi:hypothetical protein
VDAIHFVGPPHNIAICPLPGPTPELGKSLRFFQLCFSLAQLLFDTLPLGDIHNL